MNFKPLGKRVLVQRTEVESKTASGIILVDSAKEKPNTAEVKAIGGEVTEINVGDTIVFELKLISPIRRGLVNMLGKAYVNGQIVSEAEMLAQVVKENKD